MASSSLDNRDVDPKTAATTATRSPTTTMATTAVTMPSNSQTLNSDVSTSLTTTIIKINDNDENHDQTQDHYASAEEEDDEFDPYERHYHTISSPPTSLANEALKIANATSTRNLLRPSNIGIGAHEIVNRKGSNGACSSTNRGRSGSASPSLLATLNIRKNIYSNRNNNVDNNSIDPTDVIGETEKKKKKRSSLNRLMMLRPPSYPLLSRSNSTPSKSSSDKKKKKLAKQQSQQQQTLNVQHSLSPTGSLQSPNRPVSPSLRFLFNGNNNQEFFHCQHCGGIGTQFGGAVTSMIASSSDSQYDMRSPKSPTRPPRLFNRSASTDSSASISSSGTGKQPWNRRSVKYCKTKSKVLYHLVVCRFLVAPQMKVFNQQYSLCDRFEFEDIDENLVYVRFFKFYRCYDIIPISAKLIVFDTQLAVKKAFFALLSNGIRAAPLWDSCKHRFIGMLTITDFIHMLRYYYQSEDLNVEKLKEHTLDIWRSMLKEKARPLVSVEPDDSLFNAIRMLLHNKVHRLPVIDRDTGNVLYILTHKRILKFLFLFYYNRLPMPSYLQKTLRELPQIGTFENIVTATPNTPLMDALNLMVEKRISALPIVDKKNKVVDVYAKFDVIHLAADKIYQDVNITVKNALEYRAQFERVVKCTLNETLHTILERIVQAEIHRIIVVDLDDHVIGIISLSDLLNFLVLRPVNNNSLKQCCTSTTVADIDDPVLIVTPTSKSPLVEESGEEMSSICSHNNDDQDDNTTSDPMPIDDQINSDMNKKTEQNVEANQLTPAYSAESSTSNSSISICNNSNNNNQEDEENQDDDNNNNDVDPTSPTSTSAKMSILSVSTAASTKTTTQTLTA